MKIKYFLAGLLCVCLGTSMMTACANPQSAQSSEAQEVKTEKLHKLYIRAPKEFTELTVMFSCTGSGKTADVKMTKSGEDDTCAIFSCEADVNLYNLVRVKNGEKEGFDVAFNSFISGWNFEDMKNPLPYVAGTKPSYDPKLETKEFKFDGRDKKVYIWTPEDYDEKSDDKYSVIYMFDGQSILAKGVDNGMDNDVVCWNVSESVTSMMSVTDNKAIIVGITNNDVYRNDELIPDLGDINTEGGDPNMDPDEFTHKRGSAFADFLCDTVMPYVEENYNVYTDAEHTSLAGSSLGGLETFYTVLAHPDKFGTGGVMSPTFDMFAEKEWKEFLKDKTDMKNAPFLYFYAGGYSSDNGDVTMEMNNRLIESGYPKDKLVFCKYEPGEHLIEYWRSIYPEFLEAAFTQNVSALETGVPVQYEDTRDPVEEYLDEMGMDINDFTPGYVYYDNSETKWDKVYAYWWGGMSFNSVTKDAYYFAEWPGFEMERIEGSDIYRVVAPFGVTGIIFDSGVTDRAVAEGKTAYQTTDLTYSADLMGKVYKIDLSVEPSTDPGKMKTKHRYSAGNWSDYQQK